VGRSRQPSRCIMVLLPLPDAPVTPAPKSAAFSVFRHKKSSEELADIIKQAVGDTWRDYSVYVEDYRSDFTMGLSETEIFTAASVNKIPILAAFYIQVANGEIDLDRDITLQANEIQDYGTGSIRYDPPGTVYSVKTLARLMIKQSDNTAAYILANEIIGYPTRKKLVADDMGLTQTDMVVNKTSNKDIATLCRLIWEDKLVSHAYSQEMLSYLKDTDFENRLPADLPDNVSVHHKIGSEVGVIHDAGIVTDGTHTYYIGVFTNDQTNDTESEQLIARISRLVYDYMSR